MVAVEPVVAVMGPEVPPVRLTISLSVDALSLTSTCSHARSACPCQQPRPRSVAIWRTRSAGKVENRPAAAQLRPGSRR